MSHLNRILVTGAEFPAAAEAARELLGAGYQVRVVLGADATVCDWSGSDAEVFQGDLDDPALVEELLEGVDGVVHMYVRGEAPAGVSEGENLQHNLAATFNLARLSAESGRVQRFVCGSSSSVYPNDTHVLAPAYQPVDENHPLRPLDAYGLARLDSERIAQAFMHSAGLPVTIIRESGVLSGPDVLSRWTAGFVAVVLEIGQDHPRSALWAADGRQAVAEVRAGDPDQPCAVTDREGRPWLYQPVDYRDLAAGLLCALLHPDAVGGIYNLAAAQPIAFPHAAALLGEALGQPVLAWQAPTRWVYDLDCTRARAEIGYRPKWTIERMIEDAVR
ncbi:MAG TPA: NAD(P)-dependent oxidoreductase [Armatimonadota bacterium]|jgi:UDP-glucose 4-epimerase